MITMKGIGRIGTITEGNHNPGMTSLITLLGHQTADLRPPSSQLSLQPGPRPQLAPRPQPSPSPQADSHQCPTRQSWQKRQRSSA